MMQRLDEMTAPPVVGKFYHIEAIHANYNGRVDWWPVIGPKHNDQSFFKSFKWDHYHVDYRFLTKRQQDFLEKRNLWPLPRNISGAMRACASQPIIRANPKIPPSHPRQFRTTNDPQLIKRKCRAIEMKPHPTRITSLLVDKTNGFLSIRRHFGEDVKPPSCITSANGRKLCPHQRADITTLPVANDGTVICPLHGLKVQVA